MANQEEVRDVYGYFEQKGNALCYRYEAERVRIEPWGADSLRVRAWKTAPKYQKPKFDFDIQPVSIPLDDQYSNISEYDEVPTIHDLENQWKDDSKPIIETVATSMEEAPQTFNTFEASDTPEAVDFTVPPEEIEPEQEVHSEEIVRKNGIGKRSYHKITIR